MKEKICIAYTGDKVDDGSMDINELAPALLALSDLISEANIAINGKESQVNVYVKSDFQKGSFEISLEIIKTFTEQMGIFLNGLSTVSVKDIMLYIDFAGSISTVTGANLVDLIRWLKGRKPTTATKLENGNVRMQVDKEYKEISVGTYNLFKSLKVREKLEGVLSPLKREGVDGFEVRDRESRATQMRVDKSEVAYFDKPENDLLKEEHEYERIAFVQILYPNFEDGLKWHFSEGETKFHAVIRDNIFLSKVNSRRLSFAKGDILKVKIHTKQTIISGTIKEKCEIIEVMDVIKQDEQLDLPFKDESTQ